MIKNIGIVSLSRGTLGEPFISHSLALGLERLKTRGLSVKFMPNALRGIDYLSAYPEQRAQDLLDAFRDPELDLILCAIGGDDTYRLLPYLFEHDELANAVTNKPFLGFSDTTINHLMLHKVGLNTFYGQSFLADICELDCEMLPYTEKYFDELITTGSIKEVTPSKLWYECRTDFGKSQLGVPLVAHSDCGFELLQGDKIFSGEILGGCIDTLFDIFDGERYADMPQTCRKYGLFPTLEDWRGKILLLESCEEKMPPEKYRRALEYLKDTKIFEVINGILVGKPMDRAYEAEYYTALREVVSRPELPVLANLNIGHALPRCIIPFGVPATVDTDAQIIRFEVEKQHKLIR